MKKIKIVAIIVSCLAVISLIFFSIQRLNNSKKTINIDVAAESNTAVNDEPQQQANEGMEKENSDQPIIANDDKSVDSSVSNKQKEASMESAVTPEKKAEPKIVSEKIISNLVSWGFEKASSRTIKAIIVHTSYNAGSGDVFDKDKVIAQWKEYGVAPHYMIDRAGNIYQLVADQNIAWHAGVSKLPDGTTNVNAASIGIEVINSEDSKFTSEEYAALNRLIGDLQKKYSIKYILGHSEIAPGRKTDPWNLDWDKVSK